ncbi:MAG: TonB-dependent receptor [Prevotellaceae bacterium]|jgi:hypothetical protein|nr:TonB-dependent receptor [Prevotellaceae bacterium]
MKKAVFTLICLICALFVSAQNVFYTGTVVDVEGVPVEFANVALLQSTDSLIVAGDVTGSAGSFSIQAPKGDCLLKVSLLGYQTQFLKVEAENIGTVTLAPDENALQEVTITAETPLFQRKADRMVFNVENLPSTDGGDVIDILKLTPGLLVDGNRISIIGRGLLAVMINDRIIRMSGDELIGFLKGLRANDIQSIEVITTPPAKYEAEGNGGMINIVLKKTPQNTWSGSVFGSYQQTKYGYGNVGGSFNYRKNRISFYANLSHGRGKINGSDENTVYYPTLRWHIEGNGKQVYNSINAGTGLDYNITNNITIGAQYIGNFSQPKPSSSNDFTSIFNISDDNIAGNIDTRNSNQSKSNTHSANVHSIFTLDTLGRKINFDFDILHFNANSNNTYDATTSNSQIAEVPNNFVSQNNLSDREITNYSTKIDVEHPIKSFNLNYGVKLSFTRTNNDVLTHDLTSGMPQILPNQSNEFRYKENTQAIYISGNTTFGHKKWLAQVGLRGENTQWEGKSATLDSLNKNAYFKLFPTAYLTFTPNEKTIFYIEYGKRIYRPGFGELNPFRFYSSPYLYVEGNPELKPTISDNIDFGYVYNNQFQVNFAYSKEHDNRAQVIIMNNDDYVQAVKRLNYFDSYSTVLSLVYIFNKLNWWTSQNSMYGYFQHSDSKIYPITPEYMEGYGGIFRTNNVFYIDKNKKLSTGFDFTYRTPSITGDMVYNYEQTYFNAFVKMLFLNRTLSVTLTGNNLLKEFEYNTRTERNGNLTFMKGYNNPLSVRLSVSYNFGSSISVKQRETSNTEEQQRAN